MVAAMPSLRERLAGRFAAASSSAVALRVSTDTQDRFVIDAGGRLTWGDGSAAGDVTLYRSAADTLTTDDVLVGSAGVVTTTVAGVPSASLPNGAIAVDTTNSKFYFRSGGAWVEAGSGSIVIGDTPPASPATGDLWYESDTGKLFIRYDSFWVEVASAGPAGPTGPGVVTGGSKGGLLAKASGTNFDTAWTPVGTNRQTLTADSSQATGLRWTAGADDWHQPLGNQTFVPLSGGGTTPAQPNESQTGPIVSSMQLPARTLVRGATITVTTGVASSQFVLCVYSSGSDGLPNSLLASGVVDTSTTGFKTATWTPVEFPRTVWVGGYAPNSSFRANMTCFSHTGNRVQVWHSNSQSGTVKHTGLVGPANPGTTTPPATFTATGTNRYAPWVWLES